MLGVQRRRAQDLDRVDVVVGEQLVELGVAALHAPLGHPALEHLGPRVAHRHDVALLVLEITRHVQRGDVAGADDSHAYAIHGHRVTLAHNHGSLGLRCAALRPHNTLALAPPGRV